MSAPDWLDQPLLTVAMAWKLERRDGITLGFTSHDRDVEIGGLTYRSAPGMLPSSIVETSSLEPGGLDIKGALTDDALSANDLLSGRWDAARLTIFQFDWTDPNADTLFLATGTLGNVSRSGDSFSAELLGPASALNREAAPRTSPTCRASFGDGQCGIARHRFRRRSQLVATDGEYLTFDLDPVPADGAFSLGNLRWLSGANPGLRQEIAEQSGANIMLADIMPDGLAIGDVAELLEGCDKTMATCSARFGNAINFRGEPYLPGNDLLTRYPGAA